MCPFGINNEAKVIKTNKIAMMNMAPPPKVLNTSNDFLKWRCRKIKAKKTQKVNKANSEFDILSSIESLPLISQPKPTTTALAVSTTYGIDAAQ